MSERPAGKAATQGAADPDTETPALDAPTSAHERARGLVDQRGTCNIRLNYLTQSKDSYTLTCSRERCSLSSSRTSSRTTAGLPGLCIQTLRLMDLMQFNDLCALTCIRSKPCTAASSKISPSLQRLVEKCNLPERFQVVPNL